MTPYANHHLHQSRATQDSPYDASITAACTKLYNDNAYNKDCAKTSSSGGGGGGAVGDTNGYGLKDVWNTSASGNAGSGAGSVSGGGQNASSVPVRPSACTPDSRVGGYLDTSGGSPVSRGGGGGGSASGGGAAAAWNASQCAIGGSTGQSAAAASGLHQAGNHTFYPWMAIAGEFGKRKRAEINAFIIIILYYL